MKILLTLLIISSALEAAEFDSIWLKIKNRAPYLKASQSELNAATEAEERAKNHYLPKLYLRGETYNTDDAGGSFFGNLNQRAVSQADFNPTTLNEPERKTYTTTHLTASLPLYEGGMKMNGKRAKSEYKNAKSAERDYNETELFSKSANLYGTLLSLKENRQSLTSMHEELSKIITNYNIGAKENPLGYSGLLGLKSLLLRLEGEMEKNERAFDAIISMLSTLAGETITIHESDLSQFCKESFVFSDSKSHKLRSLDFYAKSLSFAKDAEKANFLPHISLFADRSFNHGERDSAGATTVGINLTWELFNGENIGAISEASEKALAMKYMHTAQLENESMIKTENQSKITAIDANLSRLLKANQNLIEQSAITTRLFKNGIVNVLQLIEVLNRRVDMILYLHEAKSEKLSALSKLYLISSNN